MASQSLRSTARTAGPHGPTARPIPSTPTRQPPPSSPATRAERRRAATESWKPSARCAWSERRPPRSPIPASSDRTNRHRINRGGAWHANSALGTVALVRMHCDSRTRDDVARHTAEGMSTTDVIRSLKGSSPARSTGSSKPPASRLRCRPPERRAWISMGRCAGQARDARPETCRTGGRPGGSRGTRPARHPG
jgi:hypothetical protein